MQSRRRLFIANVDRYDEYYIGKLLSETLTGSSVKQEENEALEESESLAEGAKQGETYEIFGTLSNSEAVPPSFVNEVFPSGRRKELYEAVVNCDFILYNIKDDPEMVDEALWMVEKIHENIAQLQTQKLFILLSSVLTWAKSAFPDENDPELPFADEDYRKRKPHHNFRDHIQVEKSTIHYGKTDKLKLLTYVVASGATYGEKQNVFHYFFKNAWNNDQFLHVLENGQNILPTIHVNDLAKIIQTVIELRPTKHYIIAKDDSQNTLYEIVKAISKALTTGKVKSISREEAFLSKDLTQNHIDQLLINLRMEASFVKEYARFRWHCENGMVEEMSKLVQEFKLARQLVAHARRNQFTHYLMLMHIFFGWESQLANGLQPIRLCILGPPASGKTTLSKRLCSYYKLHHIHIKGVIEEAMEAIKSRIKAAETGAVVDDPSTVRSPKSPTGEEEEVGELGDAEMLEALEQNMAENDGRLSMEYITNFFLQKLNSNPCQNQGYIIDGYPKTKKQAIALFTGGGALNAEEEEEGWEANEMEEGVEVKAKTEAGPSPGELFAKDYLTSGFELIDVRSEPCRLPTQPIPNKLPKGLLPDYVFELQATDKFLRHRVMMMPEQKVHNTHYTEAGMIRRLADYRVNQLGVDPTSSTAPGALNPDTDGLHATESMINSMAQASVNENSVRAYFDSKGVLQIPLNVMQNDDAEMEAVFKKIVHFLGPPRNYGLTAEEQEEIDRQAAAQELERQRAEEQRIRREAAEEEVRREQYRDEWRSKREAMLKEEMDLLNEQAEPLRAYLRKHVMPVLSKGLTECVRKRPDNPIDFLAEYLFYNNPQMD